MQDRRKALRGPGGMPLGVHLSEGLGHAGFELGAGALALKPRPPLVLAALAVKLVARNDQR